MIERILPLFAIIGLGALCAGVRLFPSVPAAIGVLNRFALYVGFPLLIVAGVGSDALTLPDGPAFYWLHVVGAALMVAGAWAVTVPRRLRAHLGTVALGATFGNIAYLGIPFIASVVGPEAVGLASLSAALHIALAMAFGPWLLLRWSGHSPPAALAKRVLRQPLVWAPLVGIGVRFAGPVRGPILSVAAPVGSAAGPVALFMVGMYLWLHRSRLSHASAPVVAVTTLKLVVYPVVMAGVVAAGAGELLTATESQVLVLQAAMPVAITTFALAEDYRIGQAPLAAAIVLSTLLSLLTLPAAAWLTTTGWTGS